jgi:hypothetical protein
LCIFIPKTMPCTALKIVKDGVENRIKFISQQQQTFTELLVYKCDQDFKVEGQPEHNASEMDEETYHRQLRVQSQKHGHFIPEESTNPEWNPDYKPEEDGNQDTIQGDMHQ